METPIVENWLADGLPAFVLCTDGSCRYSEGFPDIRLAPHACPQCGQVLLSACPHCGMLLRNRWGLCTNCGQFAHDRLTAGRRPAVKPA